MQWYRLIEVQKDEPKRRPEMKLFSVALPILATIVVTRSTDTYYNNSVFIDTQNDWMMPEDMTKNLCMSTLPLVTTLFWLIGVVRNICLREVRMHDCSHMSSLILYPWLMLAVGCGGRHAIFNGLLLGMLCVRIHECKS